MIAKTILTSGLFAMALAVSPVTTASAASGTEPDAAQSQVHLAGFKHFKKHRGVGRFGRFVNRGFRQRHFGHRGFHRDPGLGYYPGHRKHLDDKKSDKHRGVVTDRYGNPIRALRSGRELYLK